MSNQRVAGPSYLYEFDFKGEKKCLTLFMA